MQTKLRYTDYYNQTEVFDSLFERSKNGEVFNNLYRKITSKNNILLAYRLIKRNKGSKTAGMDKKTIDHYAEMDQEEFIKTIRKEFTNYKPDPVRRVMIPKASGGSRPLGIPTMKDRLIQQCIKQVLEPICEAKFFKHSYGFRPCRSASHAKARVDTLVNKAHMHYVVDVDIKGFFDNINHTLLIKQIWNMGIRDKKILAIISKMLKAPINGTVQKKGTPQGGILSPLLSNIVLHDLDIWVSNQWESYKTQSDIRMDNHKYRQLRNKTKLKEGWLVRYADDFKILTNNHANAKRWFMSIEKYLKERLKLDISHEKSKIVNLKKNSSEFLGFKIYVKPKNNKYVCHAKIRDKKKLEIKKRARKILREIKEDSGIKKVQEWNSFVLGVQNYFKYASMINIDCSEMNYQLSRCMFNQLKERGKQVYPINAPPGYKKLYKNNIKTWVVDGVWMYPLSDVQTLGNMNFSQDTTPYSREGRVKIYAYLSKNIKMQIMKLYEQNMGNRSVEYMDNRISRYSMQKGKCYVTGEFLFAEDVHCHHKKPVSLGGNDKFDNLIIIHKDIHRLIHATKSETMNKLVKALDDKQIKRVNSLRKLCKLEPIVN